MGVGGQTRSPYKWVSSNSYLLCWIIEEETKNKTKNKKQSELKQPLTMVYAHLFISSEMLKDRTDLTTAPPRTPEGRQGSELGQRKTTKNKESAGVTCFHSW